MLVGRFAVARQFRTLALLLGSALRRAAEARSILHGWDRLQSTTCAGSQPSEDEPLDSAVQWLLRNTVGVHESEVTFAIC